jgi:hypothetical protein
VPGPRDDDEGLRRRCKQCEDEPTSSASDEAELRRRERERERESEGELESARALSLSALSLSARARALSNREGCTLRPEFLISDSRDCELMVNWCFLWR